jgi:sodium transport system permease protein
MTSSFSNSVLPPLLTFGVALLLSSWLAPDSRSPQVLWRATLLQWLLLPGLAALTVWVFRFDFKKTLKLSLPSPGAIGWSSLAALGLLPLLDECSYWVYSLLAIPPSLQRELLRFLQAESISRLLLLWMALALTPALCEELFFRGFLFSRLTASWSLGASLAASSILFGLFHRSAVFFLPTLLAGFLLALVTWKTGSILPAMLIHLLVNSWGILVANSTLGMLLPWTAHPEPVPLGLLVTALAGLCFAVWRILRS